MKLLQKIHLVFSILLISLVFARAEGEGTSATSKVEINVGDFDCGRIIKFAEMALKQSPFAITQPVLWN
jgi:hypothetical protein